MKNYLKFRVILLVFVMGLNVKVLADPNDELEGARTLHVQLAQRKFYVESDMLYVSSKALFLNVAGEMLPINNLFSDQEGIFILGQEIIMARAKDGYWNCAWCGQSNFGGNYCTTCFKIRREG